MSDTELNKTLSKLSSISSCARSNKTFEFLSLAHMLNASFLRDCYKNLDRNKAVGVDGVSWEEYGRELDDNVERLVSRLKRKAYKPMPAKRVYIPKGEKETRPIGISAIETKIVEKGVSVILQSIYEEDFYGFSYGYRPKKNAHQALKKASDEITYKAVNHIVEADIKGFFDNVTHEKLIEFIKIRIKDASLIFLINRFLKAGYVDNGMLTETENGTPQGSILSPILANIFLHYVLDKWYAETVKAHVKGYCEIIRYADDFICLVQSKEEADRIKKALEKRFNKYGLELHPNKTRVFSFGKEEKQNAETEKRRANTFDFLGFTHYCDKTRKGYFKIGRKTSAKKYRAKCKGLNLWFKKIRNLVQIREWWKTLSRKLVGHYEYYGVSENYPSIVRFYKIAIRLAKKWMNRRSQKRKMSWEKMKLYLEAHPLPKPRIRHSFYVLQHATCELR